MTTAGTCPCGQAIYRLPDTCAGVTYQHGENPEHVLFVSTLAIYRSATRVGYEHRYLRARVLDWIESIHHFEDSGWQTRLEEPS